MKFLGINYTKISGERPLKGKKIEKISQNVDFVNVEKDDVELMKNSNIFRVSFKFNIKYEPDGADILLEGFVVISTDDEEAKQLLKNWKKKEIAEEERLSMLKVIMNKCSLKALNLEEELNLPHHMKLVRLNSEN